MHWEPKNVFFIYLKHKKKLLYMLCFRGFEIFRTFNTLKERKLCLRLYVGLFGTVDRFWGYFEAEEFESDLCWGSEYYVCFNTQK